MTIYVDAKEWKEAFAIAEKNPEHREKVFVPYAQWLAEQDRYQERNDWSLGSMKDDVFFFLQICGGPEGVPQGGEAG